MSKPDEHLGVARHKRTETIFLQKFALFALLKKGTGEADPKMSNMVKLKLHPRSNNEPL